MGAGAGPPGPSLRSAEFPAGCTGLAECHPPPAALQGTFETSKTYKKVQKEGNVLFNDALNTMNDRSDDPLYHLLLTTRK